MRLLVLLAIPLLLLGVMPANAAVTRIDVDSVVTNPANGHAYQLIDAGTGISWFDAAAAVQGLVYNGMHGHLATITDADENAFLVSHLLQTNELRWIWLGGLHQSGYPINMGWYWYNGEPWTYETWYGGGPNYDFEEFLQIYSCAPGAEEYCGLWNNSESYRTFITGYLVEYDDYPLGVRSETWSSIKSRYRGVIR